MKSRKFIFLCTCFATFFTCLHVFGETNVTGLWVLEIKSHSTTTESDKVMISKENSKYKINPEDGKWEIAPIEDFQVNDDSITFKMGNIVSCKLEPRKDIWSGKCMEEQHEDSAESFSVSLRLPDKPASDVASGEVPEKGTGQTP